MHLRDLLLEPWIWIIFLIITIFILIFSFYKLRSQDINFNKMIPFIGILGAFVFAAQFVNFPVAVNVSGHLIGGTLVAAIIGPYAGIFVMALVLFVQMLFMDGGVTTYGVNLFNMGVIGCFMGYFLIFGFTKLFKRIIGDRANIITSTGIASYITVVLAALLLGAELALSSNWTKLDPNLGGVIIFLMFFWYNLIGIGEVVITVLVLSFIVKVKSDIIITAKNLHINLSLEANIDRIH